MNPIEESDNNPLKHSEFDEDIPHHSVSSDFEKQMKASKQTDQLRIEKLLKSLHETNGAIQKKIQALEVIDITLEIVSFKIFEATHEFKTSINEVKEERNRILLSADNTSELSLILNDLDKKISDLEKQLDHKIKTYNVEKIELQHQEETLVPELDVDMAVMQDLFKDVKHELEGKMNALHKAQALLINTKYTPIITQLESNIADYEKLQMTGWRVVHSEVKISELLEERGLKTSPSGKLYTRTGSFITFQQAQDRDYFKDVDISLDRMVQFFKEQGQRKQALAKVGTPYSTLTESSTLQSKVSSEDVKYLKEVVGKPLTLALAEITAKQPRDPIHYLGHYLFKYRYNQELEERQKREVVELTERRNLLSRERWKKCVDEEVKNIVIDMILEAEEISDRKTLKESEQEEIMEGEEEAGEGGEREDELQEEARDKFE